MAADCRRGDAFLSVGGSHIEPQRRGPWTRHPPGRLRLRHRRPYALRTARRNRQPRLLHRLAGTRHFAAPLHVRAARGGCRAERARGRGAVARRQRGRCGGARLPYRGGRATAASTTSPKAYCARCTARKLPTRPITVPHGRRRALPARMPHRSWLESPSACASRCCRFRGGCAKGAGYAWQSPVRTPTTSLRSRMAVRPRSRCTMAATCRPGSHCRWHGDGKRNRAPSLRAEGEAVQCRGFDLECLVAYAPRNDGALKHDPEKWVPVFGKDHAPPINWSGMTIRRKVIPL